MRISDWSSDVCSSDLCQREIETIEDLKDEVEALWKAEAPNSQSGTIGSGWGCVGVLLGSDEAREALAEAWKIYFRTCRTEGLSVVDADGNLDISWPETTNGTRSEEQTSELQSLMRISYAVFSLKKKKKIRTT